MFSLDLIVPVKFTLIRKQSSGVKSHVQTLLLVSALPLL